MLYHGFTTVVLHLGAMLRVAKDYCGDGFNAMWRVAWRLGKKVAMNI